MNKCFMPSLIERWSICCKSPPQKKQKNRCQLWFAVASYFGYRVGALGTPFVSSLSESHWSVHKTCSHDSWVDNHKHRKGVLRTNTIQYHRLGALRRWFLVLRSSCSWRPIYFKRDDNFGTNSTHELTKDARLVAKLRTLCSSNWNDMYTHLIAADCLKVQRKVSTCWKTIIGWMLMFELPSPWTRV